MTIARASGPTIDWLVDRHGLQFELEVVPFEGHSVPQAHDRFSETLGTSGRELSRSLQEAANVQGVGDDNEGGPRGLDVVEVRKMEGCSREPACQPL